MKLPYWDDVNESKKIIEPTNAAIWKYGIRHGCEVVTLTQKDIDALIGGKMIAFTDNEYSTFLVFEETVMEEAA